MLDSQGMPTVVAASFGGDPPQAPDSAAFEAVAGLTRATALSDSPELHRIEREYRVSAAAPIRSDPRQAAAVLLLGPQPTRPRTLAVLERAARRLEAPLAASLAAGRLERLDRQVRQLDRLAAIGALTAEIAHEVRNPLVSVKTFLQLLPERWGDPSFSGEFMKLVTDELRRVERLLDLILAHSSPSAAAAESAVVSLASGLESALALVRHRADRRGVRLESEIEAGLPGVRLNADELRQVILNLLLNAIEATPSEGSIALRARTIDGFVELAVADEGPGVPADSREAIFEPFYSTRSERSGGLGLAITRRIVADAGGSVSVGAREGGGAEFLVRLPSSED
jgi:signal transduction histidine kinase